MAFKLRKQYRLPGADYAADGAYFITAVTKNRTHSLGEVVGETMLYSPIGQALVELIGKRLQPQTNKTSTTWIDMWTILPNHLHLIVAIRRADGVHEEAACTTDQRLLHPTSGTIAPLKIGSVSSFVNHLKGQLKRWCGANGFSDFDWQARFHDRIIRDADEYDRIWNYIEANVRNWANDTERLRP